jgi:hypothetical protein
MRRLRRTGRTAKFDLVRTQTNIAARENFFSGVCVKRKFLLPKAAESALKPEPVRSLWGQLADGEGPAT